MSLSKQTRPEASRGNAPQPRTVSIVIPTLNEAEAIGETVERAKRCPGVCEIIVADGGSADDTIKIAERSGCRVIRSAPGRGTQLRSGAVQALGDVILLLHADTWLPPNACEAILRCLQNQEVVGGGFWKEFREPTLLMTGSKMRCGLRMALGRRVLGDQGIFVRREVLEKIGGVPEMPLMEEFELCRRMRREGRLALADAMVTTSARRFKKSGVVKTYCRMGWVTLLYQLGISPQKLKRIYERD